MFKLNVYKYWEVTNYLLMQLRIYYYSAVKNEDAHLSEINQLLQYVENQFSDILLPEEIITKLELVGKGACMDTKTT